MSGFSSFTSTVRGAARFGLYAAPLFTALVIVLPLAMAATQQLDVELPPEGELLNVPLETSGYYPGEHLSYRISWGAIRAGKSTMGVSLGKNEEGRDIILLTTTTRSSKGVSLFYPVRDRIVSQVDPATGVPMSIDIDQRHGRRQRIRKVVFDQEEGWATTFQSGREPVRVQTPPRVYDILSVLYYFRAMRNLGPGQTRVIDVHEGKKNWRLVIHVEEREQIKVPAGKFDTLKIRAEVRFNGVFYDRGDVHLWLTDDERHVPVQVRVKISIGSVLMRLTGLVQGKAIASDGGVDVSASPVDTATP
ncbi:MAG: DUF3108 domain-containing protein [Leptospirillia bacterium]